MNYNIKNTGAISGSLWLKGKFGIEKENLRVDKNGKLALTPHPKAFGDREMHPYITTDFSESQIEMITPPCNSIPNALQFLDAIQDVVLSELHDEYLWPQSLPPMLPDEATIPVADFAIAKEHTQYREMLALKYGKTKQMISGLHFNFSFDEQLLSQLYDTGTYDGSYEQFRDAAYMKAIRQLLQKRWLYILLYGFSPASLPEQEFYCSPDSKPVNDHTQRLSIRNSCYGYKNHEPLYPDYSTSENYRTSIQAMVEGGSLSSSKELYAPVRLKFKDDGVTISHIEIRFIDLNPTVNSGVTAEQLHFLHLLMVHGLLTDEDHDPSNKWQEFADFNHNQSALEGLGSDVQIKDAHGTLIPAWKTAETIVQELADLMGQLSISVPEYENSIQSVQRQVAEPDLRTVIHLHKIIEQKGFIAYHMRKAVEYSVQQHTYAFSLRGFEDMELSTQLIISEAIKRGVAVEVLDREDNFIKLNKNGLEQYVQQATKTALDNYATIRAMENKAVTKHILQKHRIAVPAGKSYRTVKEALNDYNSFGGKPIVIKPKQTNFGTGITILKGGYCYTNFTHAVESAFRYDNGILIEDYIGGKEFRFLLINNELVGILHRKAAHVVGNGTCSVASLVDQKNRNPLRGTGYRTPLEKIVIDKEVREVLKEQGKSIDYVPACNETVYLRYNSNISTGGDSFDYTDMIHDSYKQIAVKASSAMNVAITGLDIIIADHTQQATASNYSIIELNHNPALHIHSYPFSGENRQAHVKLLDALGYYGSGM